MKWLALAVALLAIGAAWFFNANARTTPVAGQRVAAMSDAERLDWFWSIIERTKPGQSSQDEQLMLLHRELQKLTPGELEAFGGTMDELLTNSYSWDLWGAAYVIMGGASDDSFEYFREWMISRGRSFFETASADPDRMADLIPMEFDEIPDFELFAYAASEVWAEKTGGDSIDMPTQPDMIYSHEPSGEPFEEDSDALEKRYPLLWARFSEAPLG